MSTAAAYRRESIYKRARIIDWYSLYADKDGPETALIGQGHGQGNELCKMSNKAFDMLRPDLLNQIGSY